MTDVGTIEFILSLRHLILRNSSEHRISILIRPEKIYNAVFNVALHSELAQVNHRTQNIRLSTN